MFSTARLWAREPSGHDGTMMFAGSMLLLAGMTAGVLTVATTPAQAEPVALELVLAIDASSSVSFEEFFLQTEGLAEAFRSPGVVAAIESHAPAGVAVSVVQWSSAEVQRVVLAWTVVADEAQAAAFADRLAALPRFVLGGGTAIGAALVFAATLFKDNAFDGARRAIDVSGDGRSNQGLKTTAARDQIAALGITINGLAILNEESDVDRYYLESMIAGPDAFVLSAVDYQDFARSIRTKLIREIGGFPLVMRRAPPFAAWGAPASALAPS